MRDESAAAMIRRVGQDARLMRRILDTLEDQRTRRDLAGRLAELDDRTPIDVDRIGDMFPGHG